MPRNASPDKTVGFGWVGRWGDGDVGRIVPPFLGGYANYTERPEARATISPGDRFARCRITIEVLKDKRGRPTTRKASTLGIAKESSP